MTSREMLTATKMQERAELEYEDNLATLEYRIEMRLGAIAESKRTFMSTKSAYGSRMPSTSSQGRIEQPLGHAQVQSGGDPADIAVKDEAPPKPPLAEAESVMIRAKDDAISLWNLAMEAAEALISVPALATAGVNSGTRALPLPGLQGEREAKEKGRGGPDFSVPLIKQIQKLEREAYFGEPERQLIKDPLGVLALTSQTDIEKQNHKKRFPTSSVARPASVASMFHQDGVMRNSMAGRSLYSSIGSSSSFDPSLIRRVSLDSLYKSDPGSSSVQPEATPTDTVGPSPTSGADNAIPRTNSSVNPYLSQRLYGADKQASAPSADPSSSRTPNFPGAHPLDAKRKGLHQSKTLVIARIIPRASPSPPRRHSQPSSSDVQTPRSQGEVQTPRSQGRVASRPQSITSFIERADPQPGVSAEARAPQTAALASGPTALQASSSPFWKTLAAADEGRAMAAQGQGLGGLDAGASNADGSPGLEAREHSQSLKERMKTAITRARAAVDAMADEEQALRLNLDASRRRALGESPREGSPLR